MTSLIDEAWYESSHETGLVEKELEEKIENSIESLPDQCRNVFCLHRFENMSYVDISSHLSISLNTVKTHMTRALTRLREDLKEYL